MVSGNFLEAATLSQDRLVMRRQWATQVFTSDRHPLDPSLTHGQMDWVMDSTAKRPSKSCETKGQTRKAKASHHSGRKVTPCLTVTVSSVSMAVVWTTQDRPLTTLPQS